MDEKQQIEALYKQMYRAMVEKDTVTLDEQHADEFVLTHMTGMRQSKQENIRAIANGTLNYYEVTHEQIDIRIDGNRATLTGRSRVTSGIWRRSSYMATTTDIPPRQTRREVALHRQQSNNILKIKRNSLPVHGYRGFEEYDGGTMVNCGKKK